MRRGPAHLAIATLAAALVLPACDIVAPFDRSTDSGSPDAEVIAWDDFESGDVMGGEGFGGP